MTDQINGATGTQADPETQPPAGDVEAQAAPTGGEQSQAQPETISLDEAKKLRSEANSLRRRLKDFEDQEKARKDAELSETERLAKRVQELEAAESAAKTQLVRERTVTAAARLGFSDPEDAIAIISRTDPAVLEPDDDGTLKSVDKALADLAKSKPYLLAATQRPVGSFDTGTSAGRTVQRNFTRTQIKDPVFYAANRDAIAEAMRTGRITDG